MNIEELVEEHAKTIADEMRGVADWAESEEDLRVEVTKLIDRFLGKAGISRLGRHEYGLAGGRVDSKYGGVIIEYKAPAGAGRMSAGREGAGTRALVAQIEQRFRDFREHEQMDPARVFGAGCDGHRFVFVRHRGGKFEVESPQPITPHTVARLLRALLSLGAKGRSFTPEHLAVAFGAESRLAEAGVRSIYGAVVGMQHPRARTFFSQWKILFGEVCGYDVEGRNPKVQKLGEHYGVEGAQPAALLFSVHSYYAILMKLLAAEIASSFSPLGLSVLKQCMAAPTSEALREEMSKLEHRGIWSQIGITNFLEGDLFAWYLPAWDERVSGVVRGILETLDGFDPTTLSVDPAESRDLLKRLYQNLFPRSVRHDLGEYYTPDWLTEHTLNELGYDGDPDKRLLDPACGSGTFLVMAIGRVKAWFEEHRDQCGFREDALVQKILSNIIGFDLNPLAVMAARTNYLLAIRDLLRHAGPIELPVYLCDSVMTPAEYGPLFAGERADRRVIRTSAGEFHIPTDVASSRERMAAYAGALEFCVRNGYGAEEFRVYCEGMGIELEDERLHRALYRKLQELDAKNQNGIWARVIKNAFAPLFIGRVDYVAGNPPWVNWESLPEDYRDGMKRLWRYYGLFTLSGSAGRLGGGKKDLAMLFVYSSVHNYLRDGGRLGFVITRSVFKSEGAGDGFRQFRFSPAGGPVYLRPLVVHDLGSIQVFEGATSPAAVFVCERGRRAVRYPVRYVQWAGPGRVDQEESLALVLERTRRREIGASPIRPQKANSPWLTAPRAALPGLTKALGESEYRAHAGCCTWLNGVYWIRVVERLPDGSVLIENLHDVGHKKVDRVVVPIETALVYPLVRGQDVARWAAKPSAYLVLPQDTEKRRGIPESVLRQDCSLTWAYLRRFEGQLRERSGYKRYFRPTDPFYSVYDVGPHTLAPIKVMWRQMLPALRMAVVTRVDDPYLGSTVAVTQHVVTEVAFRTLEEAYYFSALGNSSIASLINSSYSTGKSYGTPQILRYVRIPRYNRSEEAHRTLSRLGRECHKAAAGGGSGALAAFETETEVVAAGLWGITGKELMAIQEAAAGSDWPGSTPGDDED